ncbi:MAG: hypothetical protein K5774_00740 [Clostridia bacterium]|nr:hypothetical protein [Clostridia bacterium]
MKKLICIVMCAALLLSLIGCGNDSSSGKPSGSQTPGVNEVLEQGMAEADGESGDTANDNAAEPSEDTGSGETPDEAGQEPETGQGEPAEGIDVDLTVLSSTMVYSEVYNMMSSPEDYIGKTVKMKGMFTYYHDSATDKYYFACVIQDATACCAQGIEFILTDDYTYPDDYPEIYDEICVAGVFDTYTEGDYLYCTLRDATLI